MKILVLYSRIFTVYVYNGRGNYTILYYGCNAIEILLGETVTWKRYEFLHWLKKHSLALNLHDKEELCYFKK